MKKDQVKNVEQLAVDIVPNGVANDAAIQCELLPIKGKERSLYINDMKLRQRLILRTYSLFIFQCMLVLIAKFTFPLYFTIQWTVVQASFAVTLVIYAFLYKYRNWRRKPPMNYLIFFVITVNYVCLKGLIGVTQATNWGLLTPLLLILHLLMLMALTKQTSFRFTNFKGSVIILMAYVIYITLLFVYSMDSLLLICNNAVVEALYIMYDTQLMMSNEHNYQLEPHEHFYALSNLHIDWPVFFWWLLKVTFLNKFIEIYRFFKTCCPAEVC